MAKSPESTVRLTKKERMHSTVRVVTREGAQLSQDVSTTPTGSLGPIQRVMSPIAVVGATIAGAVGTSPAPSIPLSSSGPKDVRRKQRIEGDIVRISVPAFDGARCDHRVIVHGEPNTGGWTGVPPTPDHYVGGTAVVLFKEFSDIISNPGMGIQRAYWQPETKVGGGPCEGRVWFLDTNEEIPTQSVYERFTWAELQSSARPLGIHLTPIDKVIYLACDQGRRASIRVMPFLKSPNPDGSINFRYPDPGYSRPQRLEIQKTPGWMRSSLDVHEDVALDTGVTMDIPKITKSFLLATELLARAIATRYESSRALDFVDIGYVGNTGEWTELTEQGTPSAWAATGGKINYDFAPNVNDNYPEDPTTGVMQGESILKGLARSSAGAFSGIASVVQLKPLAGVLQSALDNPDNEDYSSFDSDAGWRIDNWGDWGYSTPLKPTDPVSETYVKMRKNQEWIDASGADARAAQGPIVLEIAGVVSGIKDWTGFKVTDPAKQPHCKRSLLELAGMSVAKALLWRASFVNVKAGNIPADVCPPFRFLLRHLGYRLFPAEVRVQTSVSLSSVDPVLRIWVTFVNAGVAYCPRHYRVGIRIRDGGSGTVLGIWTAAASMHDVPPASWPDLAPVDGDPAGEANLLELVKKTMRPGRKTLGVRVPYRDYISASGAYLLDLGVVDGAGRAVVRMATKGGYDSDVLEWWYPFAKITVVP